MFGADPGHTIIMVLAVVILSQLLVQGARYKKRHDKIKEQLDRIESKLGR